MSSDFEDGAVEETLKGLQTAPLQVGDECPNFIAPFDGSGEFDFHDHVRGSWSVLFTFSAAFDACVASHFAELVPLLEDFQQRRMKVVTLMVGTQDTNDSDPFHVEKEITSQGASIANRRFREDIADVLSTVVEGFPVVTDVRGEVSRSLGLAAYPEYLKQAEEIETLKLQKKKKIKVEIDPWEVKDPKPLEAIHVRPVVSTLILDVNLRVHYNQVYPLEVAQNLYEILRIADSIILTSNNPGISTPANWKDGEEVFLLEEVDMTTDYMKAKFDKGYMEINPWFRITPQPEQVIPDLLADLDSETDSQTSAR